MIAITKIAIRRGKNNPVISNCKFQHNQLHYPIRLLFYKEAVLPACQKTKSWLNGAGDKEDANKLGQTYTTKQLKKIKRLKNHATYKGVIASKT